MSAVALSIPLLFLLQAVFVASLVLVRSGTDVAAIRDHLRDAFANGLLSDDQVPKYWPLYGGHQFTECVSLNVAIDAQTDVWKSALTPNIAFEMRDPCRELHRALDEATTPKMDYSRYWHGYRLLMWPVLDHAGVLALRAVTALLVVLASALFFFGLRAVIGAWPAAALSLTFLLLTDLWHVWRVASHGISMAVILAGTGAFALMLRRGAGETLLLAAAAALGAIFNFFDFLINPPMMPMLLAFIVLAAAATNVVPRGALRPWQGAALVTAFWFAGYAGTWATKFALAIWLLADHWHAAMDILEQINFRIHGVEAGSHIYLYPLVPTVSMLLKGLEAYGTPLVVLLAAAVYCHQRDHRQSFDRRRFALLSSPILITVAWFEILSNHTQAHPNFVYRSASMAIGIAITAALLASKVPPTPASLWQALRKRLPGPRV